MEIFNYIAIGIVAIVVIAEVVLTIISVRKKPSDEQIKDVKKWLLWAFTLSEKQLGGGTGELKLSYVYDMFIAKFPVISSIITFDEFSSYVDESLEKLKALLDSDEKVDELINNTTEAK